MHKYTPFTDDSNTDPEQRTVLAETVLYDEDGSEVIVNSKKLTIARLKEQYEQKLKGIADVDEIVDELAEIKSQLKLSDTVVKPLEKVRGKLSKKQKDLLIKEQ